MFHFVHNYHVTPHEVLKEFSSYIWINMVFLAY